MPRVLAHRFAVVAASAVISGGAASAIAIAFPGVSVAPAVVAQPIGVVATPPVVTAPPTAKPSPTPVPEPQSFVTTRSAPAVVESQPRRQPSSGSADVSQLPGPAQKAIGDQPGQPDQPSQPSQPGQP